MNGCNRLHIRLCHNPRLCFFSYFFSFLQKLGEHEESFLCRSSRADPHCTVVCRLSLSLSLSLSSFVVQLVAVTKPMVSICGRCSEAVSCWPLAGTASRKAVLAHHGTVLGSLQEATQAAARTSSQKQLARQLVQAANRPGGAWRDGWEMGRLKTIQDWRTIRGMGADCWVGPSCAEAWAGPSKPCVAPESRVDGCGDVALPQPSFYYSGTIMLGSASHCQLSCVDCAEQNDITAVLVLFVFVCVYFSRGGHFLEHRQGWPTGNQ